MDQNTTCKRHINTMLQFKQIFYLGEGEVALVATSFSAGGLAMGNRNKNNYKNKDERLQIIVRQVSIKNFHISYHYTEVKNYYRLLFLQQLYQHRGFKKIIFTRLLISQCEIMNLGTLAAEGETAAGLSLS